MAAQAESPAEIKVRGTKKVPRDERIRRRKWLMSQYALGRQRCQIELEIEDLWNIRPRTARKYAMQVERMFRAACPEQTAEELAPVMINGLRAAMDSCAKVGDWRGYNNAAFTLMRCVGLDKGSGSFTAEAIKAKEAANPIEAIAMIRALLETKSEGANHVLDFLRSALEKKEK